MSTNRPDWTDERLADAFHVLADSRPTPGDLVVATVERIRRPGDRGQDRRRLGVFGLLAATAAIALAVGAFTAGRPAIEPSPPASPAVDSARLPTPPATTVPTSGPKSFPRGFPTAVLGLSVANIATTLDLHPNFDNAEVAVKGWYVSPDPTVDCPGLRDKIRPVRPPVCAEGRHWLLDEPEDLWSDPRKKGIDRQPTGAYVNPIIPSDVIFEVPDPWSDGIASPVPVVVVGHFSDPRVTEVYAANETFVVDQLIWAAGESKPHYAVRLIDETVESGTDVLARIDRVLGPAQLSWISLVRGSDLAILDERVANSAPELTAAATVWVVRRLIYEESGGVGRSLVDFAYTADRSSRVWSGASCCSIALATTIDVRLPDIQGGGGIVELSDRANIVVGARIDDSGDPRNWKPVGPAVGWWLEVAEGDSPRELAIRWTGNRCDTTWRLSVDAGPWLDLSQDYAEGCDAVPGIERVIILELDRPVDINTVKANDNTSGG